MASVIARAVGVHDIGLLTAFDERQLVVGIVGPGIGTPRIGRRIAPVERIGHPQRHTLRGIVTNRKITPVTAREVFVRGAQRRIVGFVDIIGPLPVGGLFGPGSLELRMGRGWQLPQPQENGITVGIGDGNIRSTL